MSEEVEKLKKELNNATEVTVVQTNQERVKQLEEQLENERTLKEDYELKLKLIGEKRLEERLKELNVPENDQPYFKANPEKLEAYEKGLRGNSGTGGKGNISLRPEDMARERHSGKEGYGSYQELVKDVVERSKTEPEMAEVKRKLWEKMIRGWKESPNNTLNQTHEYPDFLKDALEAQNRKWKKGFEGRKE